MAIAYHKSISVYKFEEDPILKSAFEALTKGRQGGYIIYFSAPKQSKTRVARIEKSIGKILNGEVLHDKYNRKNKTSLQKKDLQQLYMYIKPFVCHDKGSQVNCYLTKPFTITDLLNIEKRKLIC